MIENREALLKLNVAGVNLQESMFIRNNFKEPKILFNNPEKINWNVIPLKNISKKLQKFEKEFDLNKYLQTLNLLEINYTTVYDDNYPPMLKNLEDYPDLLYYKGQLNTSAPGLSVVGSRKCTDYGKWACKTIVSGLSDYGFNIISGMALGIDKIAHLSALESQMLTTAVLGCGLDRPYPSSHTNLFNQIVSAGGCVVSEFPLGTPALPHHFPQRNRIVAGLSKAVLVIEAKERSGTSITAGQAANQGKDVFALPGNINSIYSQGTNKLIQDGAKLVTCAQDIVDEYPELTEAKNLAVKIEKDLSLLSEEESLVYEEIIEKPMSLDELSLKTEIPINNLMSLVTMMELKMLVEEVNGKWQVT